MKINIGIRKENTEAVAKELENILADEYVLYVRTQQAHWNVEGPDFFTAHNLFDNQYRQLSDIIDSIAERIRSLGHPVRASLAVFLQNTLLTENELGDTASLTFIRELLYDHEVLIAGLRKNILPFAEEFDDAGTSDFITALMQDHEKMAWMLRSHLG